MIWGSCGVSLVTRNWSSPISTLVDVTSKVRFREADRHHDKLRNAVILSSFCCMLGNLSLPLNDASPVVAGHVWENCQNGA